MAIGDNEDDQSSIFSGDDGDGGDDEELQTGSVHNDGSSNNSQASPPALAHNESVAVKRSKRLVLLVLFIAAIVVATLVHSVASGDERDSFVKEAGTFDTEIIENAQLIMRDVSGVLSSLGSTMTSSALSLNQSWPFVTTPYFHTRAQEAKMRASLVAFIVTPWVQDIDRRRWEEYATDNQKWIQDGLAYQGLEGGDPGLVSPTIYAYSGEESIGPYSDGPFAPVWQVGPAPSDASIVNMDLFSHTVIRDVMKRARKSGKAELSPILDVQFLVEHSNTEVDNRRDRRLQLVEGSSGGGVNGTMGGMNSTIGVNRTDTGPRSLVVQAVFSSFDDDKEVVGFVLATFSWSRVFKNTAVVNDMEVVLSSSCANETYTYQVEEKSAKFKGVGDLHETSMDFLLKQQEFEPFQEEREELLHIIEREDETECKYTFKIYPTKTLEKAHTTVYPLLYAFVVVFIFSSTSLVFILYDQMVIRRQRKVMQSAITANAIVSSIFPATVQDRLLQNAEEEANKKGGGPARHGGGFPFGPQRHLHSGEKEETKGLVTAYSTKPIADLFTHATVMFADIAGFTAWSSVREASQVFILLETVYASFDRVAKALKVFKVETIGDCYVAVAGLPVPRHDHATVMGSFAVKCLLRFEDLTKKLEEILGPGTGSLGLRIGLHSGPVTAGVLRGDNARFQLFGDTVNVASRMESTGEKGKIQVSTETAALLAQAGKTVTPRAEPVEAKGKGLLCTYWLSTSNASSNGTHRSANDDDFIAGDVDKVDMSSQARSKGVARPPPCQLQAEMNRLIEWNANNLVQLLQVLHARRRVSKSPKQGNHQQLGIRRSHEGAGMVLDEVKEIIELPQFDVASVEQEVATSQMQLNPQVIPEVKLFVKCIAERYQRNPFHNFEHASHVTMSVVKLLSRISNTGDDRGEKSHAMRSQHHLDTYGITSDPLTCFGCVFSALIHDVDHPGVSNAQLVAEGGPLVKLYAGKSVAEQNSVDIAWTLLSESRFANFREAIFANEEELVRFRQVLVNSVMATDIMDKELKQLRDSRWDKAFHDKKVVEESVAAYPGGKIEDCLNRKATIVIEHLIQASDVSHTMQHWHVYREWNEKLYVEMYQAYKDGRSPTDPTIGWYQGEIGFFDYYIIPLAKKLADCGVFGVSSFEYLNFATRNREEWVAKGEKIVQEMRRAVGESPDSCVPVGETFEL